MARVAFLDLDRDLAAEKYKVIEENSQGALKAESMYHLAYLAFYEGDYELSKELENIALLIFQMDGLCSLLTWYMTIWILKLH